MPANRRTRSHPLPGPPPAQEVASSLLSCGTGTIGRPPQPGEDGTVGGCAHARRRCEPHRTAIDLQVPAGVLDQIVGRVGEVARQA